MPFADAGAFTGNKPRTLNCLNWTATQLFDSGVKSAFTCHVQRSVSSPHHANRFPCMQNWHGTSCWRKIEPDLRKLRSLYLQPSDLGHLHEHMLADEYISLSDDDYIAFAMQDNMIMSAINAPGSGRLCMKVTYELIDWTNRPQKGWSAGAQYGGAGSVLQLPTTVYQRRLQRVPAGALEFLQCNCSYPYLWTFGSQTWLVSAILACLACKSWHTQALDEYSNSIHGIAAGSVACTWWDFSPPTL